MNPTHAELVDRAVRWLRGTRRCSVAYGELTTGAACIPDAIGWGWKSEMVEVKVSRGDFRRDGAKGSHLSGTLPGELRWYVTPPRLVVPEEIPEGWGLVWAFPASMRVVREAPVLALTPAALLTERALLLSAARRHELGVPFDPVRGRFQPLADRVCP